uniref:Uncharacterized protein n=1 Tax=Glossina palpalis gambiensis TaxID=67801 RepID=A0A1B0BBJ4_9MUSC
MLTYVTPRVSPTPMDEWLAGWLAGWLVKHSMPLIHSMLSSSCRELGWKNLFQCIDILIDLAIALATNLYLVSLVIALHCCFVYRLQKHGKATYPHSHQHLIFIGIVHFMCSIENEIAYKSKLCYLHQKVSVVKVMLITI